MLSINQYCPHSGKPVAADSLTRYRGFTVGFCNPGCRDDFARQSESFPGDISYFDTLIKEHGLAVLPPVAPLPCPSSAISASTTFLYETHLPVRNTKLSSEFYRTVAGLAYAYSHPDRDVVFLWIGLERRSMLGLWGPGTTYGQPLARHHLAIALSLPDLLVVGEKLNGHGVATRNFAGESTSEPSVIGWMPSAQLYFNDPDGHVLEFSALLDETPDASFVGPFSHWKIRAQPTV